MKSRQWTHFSAFEVWGNIREEEVRELEGILRHIFRKDSHANKLGIQKSFKKLTKIRRETEKGNWWDNRRSRRLANKIALPHNLKSMLFPNPSSLKSTAFPASTGDIRFTLHASRDLS